MTETERMVLHGDRGMKAMKVGLAIGGLVVCAMAVLFPLAALVVADATASTRRDLLILLPVMLVATVIASWATHRLATAEAARLEFHDGTLRFNNMGGRTIVLQRSHVAALWVYRRSWSATVIGFRDHAGGTFAKLKAVQFSQRDRAAMERMLVAWGVPETKAPWWYWPDRRPYEGAGDPALRQSRRRFRR